MGVRLSSATWYLVIRPGFGPDLTSVRVAMGAELRKTGTKSGQRIVRKLAKQNDVLDE